MIIRLLYHFLSYSMKVDLPYLTTGTRLDSAVPFRADDVGVRVRWSHLDLGERRLAVVREVAVGLPCFTVVR